MARAVEPVVRFLPQIERALEAGDFGDETEPGVFFKPLGTIHSAPVAGEVEQAPPVSRIKPRTLAEREKMPRELAMTLVKHYMDTMNDSTKINPLRDGIPQCRAHPFKSGKFPGCYKGCRTGILPRSTDHTLGDVIEWVQALVNYNFKVWLEARPELRGYVSGVWSA